MPAGQGEDELVSAACDAEVNALERAARLLDAQVVGGAKPKVISRWRSRADQRQQFRVVAIGDQRPSGFRPSISEASSLRTPSRSPKPSRCSGPMLVMAAICGSGIGERGASSPG